MKKNKVGIVTLNGYYNYGNRLQNYALKLFLEKMGYEVSTTIIMNKNISRKMYVKKIYLDSSRNVFKTFSFLLRSRLIKNNKRKENNNLSNNRRFKFEQFSKTHLNERFFDLTTTEDNIKLSNYSYFIAGSDQVWNPIEYSNLPINFLTFIDKEKRVAYAPSIGLEVLPNEYITDYKRWIDGISSISIREIAGANIIKELTGKDAPVLVDPTMLLSKEEWLEVSERASNRPDGKYILTYFLGGLSKEMKLRVDKIAEENNMQIINLGDISETESYQTGPSEFIDYIENASVFFTDSFHGVVFSIILETPFVVFERKSSGPSMYSRIETLLDNFEMRNREAKDFKEEVFTMDFSHAHKVLFKEQIKSTEYLEHALGSEENK